METIQHTVKEMTKYIIEGTNLFEKTKTNKNRIYTYTIHFGNQEILSDHKNVTQLMHDVVSHKESVVGDILFTANNTFRMDIYPKKKVPVRQIDTEADELIETIKNAYPCSTDSEYTSDHISELLKTIVEFVRRNHK